MKDWYGAIVRKSLLWNLHQFCLLEPAAVYLITAMSSHVWPQENGCFVNECVSNKCVCLFDETDSWLFDFRLHVTQRSCMLLSCPRVAFHEWHPKLLELVLFRSSQVSLRAVADWNCHGAGNVVKSSRVCWCRFLTVILQES